MKKGLAQRESSVGWDRHFERRLLETCGMAVEGVDFAFVDWLSRQMFVESIAKWKEESRY